MIRAFFTIVLLASCWAQSAPSSVSVDFSVTNSQLVNQLSYQSSSAANTRSYAVIRLGDTVFTTSFSSQSNLNTSSGSGSETSAANSIAWISSSAGVAWGSFSSGSSAGRNVGSGQVDLTASLIASAFNPLALVYYTDNNSNGLYDQGEELQPATATASLSFSANTETTSTTGSSGIIIVTHVSGSLNFRYTAANRPFINQGFKINDDSTKIDLQINPSYPSNAPANTRVALVALFGVVQASSSFQGSVNNGNATFVGSAAVSVSNNGNSGGLSWSGSADVTSSTGSQSTANVATSALQLHTSSSVTIGNATISIDATYKNNRVLVFNFQADKPSSIYWDPQMGGSVNSAAHGRRCDIVSIVSTVMVVVLALSL